MIHLANLTTCASSCCGAYGSCGVYALMNTIEYNPERDDLNVGIHIICYHILLLKHKIFVCGFM